MQLSRNSGSVRILELEQFNTEHQRCVFRHHALYFTGAIGHARRYQQHPLAARFHAEYAFVPALHDTIGADDEGDGLALAAGIVDFTAAGALLINPADKVNGGDLPKTSLLS